MKGCLTKLGLKINQETNSVPSLSRLHLTSMQPAETSKIIAALQDIITVEEGEEYIKDENDTFHLEKPSAWSLSSLAESLPGEPNEKTDRCDLIEDKIIDYSTVVKRLLIHDKEHPTSKETPYFNHHAFFANLKHYQSKGKEAALDFGKNLMYGEVVTSTNTMLEKCVSWFITCICSCLLNR